MSTATVPHAGLASDLGRRRTVNEDRVFADDARGIFLVVDGLGGHAAGEVAAEAAVQAIAERMRSASLDHDLESSIRQAITAANNRIYQLASTRSEWHGMACVLTLAVVNENRVTIGHVGDSRLYLSWNGQLKKLTSDHSPVGEQEDQGVLTEQEAMSHPRRNEVFRDVGSHLHAPDDPQFIDVSSFPLRSDAALLLASDGLSDVLTSAQINAILENFDGTPDRTAQQLIAAANEAGGTDNISVVFVPGPEFAGKESVALQDARTRHVITRMRGDEPRWRRVLRNTFWLLVGMSVASLLWWSPKLFTAESTAAAGASGVRLRAPILVTPSDLHGIQKALENAVPGDTIEVPAGDYLGPLELKNHVDVVGKGAKVRVDPQASSDEGIAIVARGIDAGRVEGLHVVADPAHALKVGVWISGSSIEAINLDISGALEAGVRIDGTSQPTLLANFIHANPGTGLMIKGGSAPLLIANWIVENGKSSQALRPGIEADLEARPQLSNNVIARNGVAGKFRADPLEERSK